MNNETEQKDFIPVPDENPPVEKATLDTNVVRAGNYPSVEPGRLSALRADFIDLQAKVRKIAPHLF